MALSVLIALVGSTLVNATPASATPAPDSITVQGYGFGHGRGMSQYGALGYAIDFGWTYEEILDQYYSNTTFGDPVPDDDIKVHLTALDRTALRITSGSPFKVDGIHFAAGEAARIRVVGVDAFAVDRGTDCRGDDWIEVSTGIAGTEGQNGHPYIEARVELEEQLDDLDQFLRVCTENNERSYRGQLRVVEIGGEAFTLNRLPIEQYLRGVVPRESPSFWGTLGDGAGIEALKAQAVAARSYSVALTALRRAGTFASDTCDTQTCQVYGGAALNGLPLDHGPSQQTTNTAVEATAGQVRRHDGGAVAFTEYASSTGGWTAPMSEGNAFPAVEDLGDATDRNPSYEWSTTISRSVIEDVWPSIGTLERIEVPLRNGLGRSGGRVRGIDLIGTDGTVELRFDNWGGDVFRRTFGLRSDWYEFPDFEPATQPDPTEPDPTASDPQGLYVVKEDGTVLTFGTAVHRGDMGDADLAKPIVGMSITDSGDGYWLVASDGGVFAFGDAVFHGSTGDLDLVRPIVGMATVPGGGGYWMVASDGGVFAFGSAKFYGSMGATALNRPVVGMAPAPEGAGYWMVASDGGVFAFGSASFFGSTGNLSLVRPIVAMIPSSTGRGYSFVASDGGVFVFGDGAFLGSRGGRDNGGDVVGLASSLDGSSYWIVTDSGRSYPFGQATDFVTSIAGIGVVTVRAAR